MDINGYYYGRLWTCLTLFSKPATYMYTVKMTESNHKKTYQGFLERKLVEQFNKQS